MNKTQARLTKTLQEQGSLVIAWRGDYGQRVRKAAHAMQDAGLAHITAPKHHKDGSTTAILVKA